MSKAEIISRLNYILGRIEGVACGVPVEQQSYLLDTAEWLQDVIENLDNLEFICPFEEDEKNESKT